MNISLNKIVLLSYLIFTSIHASAVGMSVRSQGTASYTSASGKSNALTIIGSFVFPNWVSGAPVTTTITPSGGSGTYTFSPAVDSVGCAVDSNTGVVTANAVGACKVIVSDGLNSVSIGPVTITASNLASGISHCTVSLSNCSSPWVRARLPELKLSTCTSQSIPSSPTIYTLIFDSNHFDQAPGTGLAYNGFTLADLYGSNNREVLPYNGPWKLKTWDPGNGMSYKAYICVQRY